MPIRSWTQPGFPFLLWICDGNGGSNLFPSWTAALRLLKQKRPAATFVNILFAAMIASTVRCFHTSANSAWMLRNAVQLEMDVCPLRYDRVQTGTAWRRNAHSRTKPGATTGRMVPGDEPGDRRDALSRLVLLAVGSTVAMLAPCPAAAAAAPGDEDATAAIMMRLDGTPGSLLSMGEALPMGTRQVFYPEWMLGDWAVTSRLYRASYPQGAPPPGRLGEGTLRSSDERVGSEIRLDTRYKIDRSSVGGIRASTKKMVVEDRATSESAEARVLRGSKVSEALYRFVYSQED